jgi:hypothetical protein
LLGAALAVGLYYRSHQQSKRLTDKDTIVLADFNNKTGDPIFDDTLKTALTVSLQQSPFLNVLSDSKIAETLHLMTRPADTALTPAVTRELCQRAGAKAYIAGSIGSLGTPLERRSITSKARPPPCPTISMPSSLIRILPWATGQSVVTTSVSAS